MNVTVTYINEIYSVRSCHVSVIGPHHMHCIDVTYCCRCSM